MNFMAKMMLVFAAVSIMAAPGLAGLLEDVDDLTPDEAVQLQQKLQQKRFEALPENSRGTVFVQLIDPAQFNDAFTGVNHIGNLYGASFDLRMPLSKKFLLGGSFGVGGNYVMTESSPKIFEDLFLFYGSAQLVADFRILQNDYFILSATPGAGVILGGFNYTKTDDNIQTYYSTNRWGSGLCTSLSLDATWKVHEDWGFGLGVSSFSGKLANMRKIISSVDAAAPEIDLTGTTFRISGSKYF